MGSIIINLQEDQVVRLREMANKLSVSVEELARVSIEELLAAEDERFEKASDHVLKKNENLYRELA